MNPSPQFGIRANLAQFSLLVLINSFVGAMVGMERSILPLIAEHDFGISSNTTILSFLITFGVVKALSNLLAGRYADLFGRRKILIVGWLTGIPVPFMLMSAQSWSWIVAANILLAINQGFCWSTTVIMKTDLAGPDQRGLAMGLNEFAGYIAVALTTYATAFIASEYGYRPFPFYLGIGFSVAGFLLSALFAKETHGHATAESQADMSDSPLTTHHSLSQGMTSFKEIFSVTSWTNKSLFSCSQAGLVNNLNDGMVWGILPLFLASLGLSLRSIGYLAALYPATWGITQLITGAVSDKIGRKWMIVAGMWMQACSIWLIASVRDFGWQATAAILLGIGTAMVYPTLLAAVGDIAVPEWRASAVGVYRLWRDLGYAIGAAFCGVIADTFGLSQAIVAVGFLTFVSGVVVSVQFKERMGVGS